MVSSTIPSRRGRSVGSLGQFFMVSSNDLAHGSQERMLKRSNKDATMFSGLRSQARDTMQGLSDRPPRYRYRIKTLALQKGTTECDPRMK